MSPTEADSEPRPALKLPLMHAATVGGTMPQALTVPGSRGADGAGISLLGNVQVKRSWQLAPVSRSGDAAHAEVLSSNQGLLALEATDGTTIFTRTDTLVAQLRRTRPDLIDDDGVIDFARFRDTADVSRGAVSWIWQQVSELALSDDAITAEAREQITELLGGVVIDWAARKSAKALMAAVERTLAGEPGLYRWDGGLLQAQDLHGPLDVRLAEAAQAGPLLVFIHGTGSHTLGSFGDLPGTGAWRALQSAFGQRIFGFEHRTFSESPIDNALALVNTLAPGTRLNVVTHSRGGLVGDLLCLDPTDKGLGELIERYRSNPRPDEAERERNNPALAVEREQVAAEEQLKLRQLVDLLKQKNLQVGRYVRVAAPARGTALLSDNLDVFLSCLLGLVRKFGAWSIGTAVGLVATPVAGVKARELADNGLKFLSRIVLEIADKRLEPQTVPGIEAMLPEAPMSMLLGRARVSPSVKMAVIAGDIEAGGAGVLQRVGVMFVDWAFFDRARNDLVVDTDSMYGGILTRVDQARAIFVHSAQVNHFRYFRDDVKYQNLPLPSALGAWLLDAVPQGRVPWQEPLTLPDLAPVADRGADRGAPEPLANARPVLIFLPGIMGSHLAADGNRVWLDPLGLATGSLPRIAMNSRRTVRKDGLVELTYAKLAEFLQISHQVIVHDYDWRQPIAALGKGLAEVIRKALTANPDQPVRLLAHSMGGLLVRAAFAADKTLWPELVARPGGRLLMLGTPNQGSYSFVETLLGQSDTVRMLARVDVTHNLQDVLNVVAGFPGALHLLPAPGFEDTGGPVGKDLYQESSWQYLARLNDDFWFGDNLGGRPDQAALDEARAFWKDMLDTQWVDLDHERIAYVFGKADNTPCGLQILEQGGRPVRVMIRGTPNGDGSVTWRSGRLSNLPEDRYWFMPVDHGGLTGTAEFFSEIQALLSKGVPNRLGRLPLSRSEEQRAPLISYRGGPPLYPTDQELVSRMLGSRSSILRSRKRNVLQITVKAMDLSFIQVPVMCGHYRGDPISGAEAVIDRTLVNGALSHRQRLGLHSGEMGNATVVLMPRSSEEHLRQTGRGALVVGLGEMGTLAAEGVTQAVRAGVLRYLLHASDFYGKETGLSPDAQGVALSLRLASLLIGTNSSSQLSINDSVKAVVLGVLLANRDFTAGAAERGATQALISRLELVEVFRDTAISAAYAVSELNKDLATELAHLDTKLELADELQYGEGVRQRLSVSPFSDYWPRLSVSSDDMVDVSSDTSGHDPAGPILLRAKSFRFSYMGDKARVEALVEQRQPGLVEKLVDSSLKGQGCNVYQKNSFFGNTLFQLLLPLAFKSSVRRSRNLILMVDESSANLPWEMLETDGEPLIKRTRMIRQFITERFRREVLRTDSMSACVIANPSTEGYYTQFGGPQWKQKVTLTGEPPPDCLPSLDGAEKEGEAVTQVLEGAGYTTFRVLPDAGAGEVFTQLFARPYRVLVVAAHGIFGKAGADGIYRSGVVLSDGLLLTAAEIDRMEIVPDLVFLSCCHLAKMDDFAKSDNRLAASLARELINMGVRCVVAAGWEVRDDAAKTFAETFFMRMALHGDSFGAAISTARLVVLDGYPDCNTWGAYQAYGDPSFQLKLIPGDGKSDVPLRAPEELLDWIERIRLAALAPCTVATRLDFETLSRRIAQRLRSLPPQWAQMPEIQYTLGLLYSECGAAGYEAACYALLQSIAADFARAVVPLRAVEQLVNIEARRAQALAEQAQALHKAGQTAEAKAVADSALVLIEDAIARATALIKLASPHPDSASSFRDSGAAHPERQAILGSAHKRKAVILWMARKPWKTVEPSLVQARDAYALGEGDPNTPDWNPYARINRLQLDALLGVVHADLSEVVRCQAAARARFQKGFDFFDGVMSADAAVAGWLLTGSLPQQAQGVVAAKPLCDLYWDALQGQRASVRQFDSVVRQLGLLASFLLLRAAKGDSQKAKVLQNLADALHKGER